MTESFDNYENRERIPGHSETGAEREPSIYVEGEKSVENTVEVGEKTFKKPPEGISTKNIEYYRDRDRLPVGDINEAKEEVLEAQEKTLESLTDNLLNMLDDPDMDSGKADRIILAMSALKQRIDRSKEEDS